MEFTVNRQTIYTDLLFGSVPNCPPPTYLNFLVKIPALLTEKYIKMWNYYYSVLLKLFHQVKPALWTLRHKGSQVPKCAMWCLMYTPICRASSA